MGSSSDLLEIYDFNSISKTAIIDFCEIPIADDNLDYSNFFQSYLLNNKPCIVKNVSNNWSATTNWLKNNSLNLDYFRNNIPNVEVPVSNCGKKQYNVQEKCTMKLFDYLDFWEAYEKSYAQMDCLYLKDWHFTKEFKNEVVYRVPSYFASDWLNEYYESNSVLDDDYRFVYIGPKGSWTPFHVDVFTSYSWSVNICGKKKWILFPPKIEENFRDNLGNLIYDISTVMEKKKEFLHFEVIQEKGDGLFIPSGWYHQVWNLENTISINHNWINGCNIHYVWNSLKKSLIDVKKEIFDCHEMENWPEQCQKILSASFGFDYKFFYSLLMHVAISRITALKANNNFCVYGRWFLGEKHLKFDLKQALSVLNFMRADDDFLEIMNSEEILTQFLECLDSYNSLVQIDNEIS